MAITENSGIGEKVTDFTLQTDEDNTVSLSEYAGQPVILFFYPRADTPGCTIEACGFRDAFEKLQSAGAVVLGISRDTPKAQAKFRAKYELPYTLLADVDEKVCNLFGVLKEKNMYGKKVWGIERTTYLIGPDGTLLLDGYQSWIANNAISYGQQAADTRGFGFDGGNLIRVLWNKVTATGGCVNGDGLRIYSARNKSANISWGFNEFDGTGASGDTIGCRYASNMNNSSDTTWYPQSGFYYGNNIHDCAVPWEMYDGTAGYINVWSNTFKPNGTNPTIIPPGQQVEAWKGYWNSNTLTGSEPKVNSTHDSQYYAFNAGTDIEVYASFALTDLSDQTNPYFHFNSSWGGYDANSYTPSPPQNLRAI